MLSTRVLNRVTPLTLRRLSEVPHLAGGALALDDAVWPAFVDSTDAGVRFWESIFFELAAYQFLALGEGERVVATGHTIPVYWDGSRDGLPVGWDDGLTQGMLRHRAGASVNTLSGLAISIDPEFRGQRIGTRMIYEMKRIAAQHKFGSFIGAVRPTIKALYPWMSMEAYIGWRRKDGTAFDPWIRAHESVGGKILCVAKRSMVVDAPIHKWEEWTGRRFPTPGPYAIADALVPLIIDIENDRGLYEEPNVWMIHGAGARTDRELYPPA